MIRDYFALLGCVSLLGGALWFATRLVRRGGSTVERGTPHWDRATTDTPCAGLACQMSHGGPCWGSAEPVHPQRTFTPEQRARLDEAMAKVRAEYEARKKGGG